MLRPIAPSAHLTLYSAGQPPPPPPPPPRPAVPLYLKKNKIKKATWQNMIPRLRPSTPVDARPGVEVKSEELWGTTVPLSFLISPACRVVEGEVSQRETERKAVAVQTRGYCRRGRANVTSSHDWCDCVYSISEGIPTPFLPFLPSSQHSEPTRVMFPVVNSVEGKRPGIILLSEVTYVAFASVGDRVRGTRDRPQDVTLQKC